MITQWGRHLQGLPDTFLGKSTHPSYTPSSNASFITRSLQGQDHHCWEDMDRIHGHAVVWLSNNILCPSSVTVNQFSCSVMSDSLRPHGLQHARLPCPSPTPRVYSNSCPLSRWCHPIISSPVVPFSSCPQSFPASRSFLMSQLFTSGGQSFGVSASASVLPMNIQDRLRIEGKVLCPRLPGFIYFSLKLWCLFEIQHD